MPKVSVIVPNYNHAPYLNERIDSILAQTFHDFELILMDDNSSDNSRKVLEGYRSLPNVKIVFNEKNSGSSFKQWNKGVKLALGEYIWIAESDDVAAPEFLATLLGVLEGNPDVALAYTQSYEINSSSFITGNWFDHTKTLDVRKWTADFTIAGNEMIGKFMVHHNCIPNASAVMFRKDKMVAIGMADETFKLNGDWLFWIRLMENSKVAFVAKSLNYFRKHNTTVRNTLQKVGTGVYEYSKILEYLLLNFQMTEKEKRSIMLRFYSKVKWSPSFIGMDKEWKAFKLLRDAYAHLIKYDKIAIWLFMKHLFRRFCYLYVSMFLDLFRVKAPAKTVD